MFFLISKLIALSFLVMSSGFAEARQVNPIEINPDYITGGVSTSGKGIPTLSDMRSLEKTVLETPDITDKLRLPAMEEAALTYGAQGGLASESKNINTYLKDQSKELGEIYDFKRLIIDGPNGTKIIPPIISESLKNWESHDDGKTLRIAEKYYEIIQDARFLPNAPLWHEYLLRSPTAPEPPFNELLPTSQGERTLWKKWITRGWITGVDQAQHIFKKDLAKLNQAFLGMIKFKELLAQNMVNRPFVAGGNLGVITSTDGKNMRIDDVEIRITHEALMNPHNKTWIPGLE